MTGITQGITQPGFADPVAESQAVFRAVLDAMARPGRMHEVAAPAAPPPGLDRATAAVLLTLVDAETPLWLDQAAAPAREWVLFHCGAALASAAEAQFAVAVGPAPLAAFPAGTDDAPETGATVILQVQALGDGPALRLSGPGLAAPATLAVTGLPADFVAFWAANRALFPRGIDVILCAGDRLAALPRSVHVEPT
ncbi:MAG: phosphonate C-P lyase system protein PhnH [Acetobacteraceae bacterium]